MINVLKFGTLFSFCSQIECWFSGLEFTKSLRPEIQVMSCKQISHAVTKLARNHLHIGYFFQLFYGLQIILIKTFSKISFKNTISVSSVLNSLDPDHAWQFVRPDLGPTYLQRLAGNKSYY